MLTKRDNAIIRFVEDFGAASRSQIERLFFTGQKYQRIIANRRLREIVNQTDYVKRSKEPYTGQYIYHLAGLKQLQHRLLRTEFYLRLKEQGGLIKTFACEYAVDGLRADAYCVYEIGGKRYYFALEVQNEQNRPNIGKYIALHDSEVWPWKVFPRVVIITDRKIEVKTEFAVIILDTSLKEFENIFKTPAR